MPALTRWLCPTCRREVKPTAKGNIVGHLDSIRRDKCPSSGEPWRTTVMSDPEFLGVEVGDVEGAA